MVVVVNVRGLSFFTVEFVIITVDFVALSGVVCESVPVLLPKPDECVYVPVSLIAIYRYLVVAQSIQQSSRGHTGNLLCSVSGARCVCQCSTLGLLSIITTARLVVS